MNKEINVMKKDKEMRMREKTRASMGRTTLSFSHFLEEYLCFHFLTLAIYIDCYTSSKVFSAGSRTEHWWRCS
jgi:hypothetical protein